MSTSVGRGRRQWQQNAMNGDGHCDDNDDEMAPSGE